MEVFEADDGEVGSGEAVLTGVLGGAGLAFGGAWAGGAGGIGAIGGEGLGGERARLGRVGFGGTGHAMTFLTRGLAWGLAGDGLRGREVVEGKGIIPGMGR